MNKKARTKMNEIAYSYGCLKWRPNFLQCLNKPLCFLAFISIAGFFQGALVNGFVNASLSSIERRFGVGSKTVSFISVSFDISGKILILKKVCKRSILYIPFL